MPYKIFAKLHVLLKTYYLLIATYYSYYYHIMLCWNLLPFNLLRKLIKEYFFSYQLSICIGT